jgi:hypothetical protein
MRFSTRFRLGSFVVLGGLLAFLLPTSGARAIAPGYFPQPQFAESSTAYTMRFAGLDRFATAGDGALTAAVNQDKTTGWPFNEGHALDPTKAYGASACPGTVFIVASDGLPDALAASALRGLANVAVSGHSYNTANALLLLTDTARPPANATTLNDETRTVLAAFKGACGGFDALILGGPAAVATSVEGDVGAYANTVGRIAGVDRFDTAAQIAAAVSSAAGLGHLNYYASSSSGAAAKTGLVFLAEGLTGADALAVGPIAADTNAPILLTSGSQLDGFTASALGSLRPANIVVLGGQSAIPDAAATQAKTAAGSPNAPLRISGPNRFATSVALAEQLDNLWPQNALNQAQQDQASFSNQGFGLARSEGSLAAHVGWPDALSSAMVLASLRNKSTVPQRLVPPVETNVGTKFLGGIPSSATSEKGRMPLLLTSGAQLAPEVDAYLRGLYPQATPNTTMTGPTTSVTDDGGFGFVFGGQAAILPAVELAVAQDLSGGAYTAGAMRTDLAPTLDQTKVFYTHMPLDQYLNATLNGPDGGINMPAPQAAIGDKLCFARAAASGVQQYDIASNNALFEPPRQVFYETSGAYSPGKSVPQCTPVSALSSQAALLLGISLSGSVTAFVSRSWSSPSSLLQTPATNGGAAQNVSEMPMLVGNIDTPALPSMPTVFKASYPNIAMPATYKGTAYPSGPCATMACGTMALTITRTNASSPGVDDSITCSGTISETNGSANVFTASFAADSATEPSSPAPGGTIKCVGEYAIGTATGGIRFTITNDNTNATLSDLVLDGNA